ncbi:MAG: sigma-70 family RNA polymerase sigma factor [Planctomycetota bacterium]
MSSDPAPSAAGAGDPGVETLLERHLPSLRAFVRLRAGNAIRARESQSDLVQSVCRELLGGAERFSYRGDTEFRNWLYTAVLRKIVERDRYYRAQKRDIDREMAPRGGEDGDAALRQQYASVATPSAAAASAEELARIETAFDGLSEEQREIITLSRIVGLSHAEIGAKLGRSEQASRQLLRRALIRLSMALEEDGSA